MKSSINIANNLLELKNLESHIRALQGKWKISRKDALEINLVLDELITNIIEHGNNGQHNTIEINFSLKNNNLIVKIIDSGRSFDPTRCRAPDTSLPLERRKCGGLGLLLVRKFCESCSYTRLQGKNIFSLTKNLTEECR